MEIREAKEEDTDQILTLTNLVADKHGKNRQDILRRHPYHITKEKIERDLKSARHIFLVACENGAVVGMVLCKVRNYCDDPKYLDSTVLSIEDTCVLEEFQGKGVGSALLLKAKEIAGKLHCQRLESNVWAFNEESYQFFQKNNFSVQRMIMEYECPSELADADMAF